MMRSAILATVATVGVSAGICSQVLPNVPSECIVSKDCLHFDCGFTLAGKSINVTLDISPCAHPAIFDVGIEIPSMGIDFNYPFPADQQFHEPIPGASLAISKNLAVGLFANVDVSGDVSEMDIDLAVDACGDVAGIIDVCGSQLPYVGQYLPFQILNQTIDFSDACKKPVAKKAAPTVSMKLRTVSAPKIDLCPECIDFTEQALDQLLNYIVNAGVAGTCTELCSSLSSATEKEICTVLCSYVGIEAFIKILEQEDLDPIYFCELVHGCKPGSDTASARVVGTKSSPPKGPEGTTFNLELDFSVTNATGVGEISFTFQGPNFDSTGQAFVNEGFAAGNYGVQVQLDASDQPDADPPVTFSPGVYTYTFELCQGECDSKHPHSKVFGRINGNFTITA